MIIDGKELSNKILEKQKELLATYKNKCKLLVISIGHDDASAVYVNNKRKAAESVGMFFEHKQFSDTDSFETISNYILYNGHFNDLVHGIIVQLPIVSKVLDEKEKKKLTELVTISKDVDGFIPYGYFTPCTPKGVIRIIESIPNYKFEGKTALVIGRSEIVGKPVAKLLLDKNCTVIQAHSKTPKERLLKMFSFSDIVVSAVGRTNLLTEEDAYQYWKDNRHDFYGDLNAKRDRIIVDVGINRDVDGKLCGDLSESFKQKYSEYYTPVPRGVGPMTVAMLIENTVQSFIDKQGV